MKRCALSLYTISPRHMLNTFMCLATPCALTRRDEHTRTYTTSIRDTRRATDPHRRADAHI
jgi:hypothetical protein